MTCRTVRFMQRSRSLTRRKIGLNVAMIVATPSWLTPANVLLKVIAVHLSDYYERENILQDKQCMFRPQRSTVHMMFVVRRLQKISQKKNTPLYLCFIDHTKKI